MKEEKTCHAAEAHTNNSSSSWFSGGFGRKVQRGCWQSGNSPFRCRTPSKKKEKKKTRQRAKNKTTRAAQKHAPQKAQKNTPKGGIPDERPRRVRAVQIAARCDSGTRWSNAQRGNNPRRGAAFRSAEDRAVLNAKQESTRLHDSCCLRKQQESWNLVMES